MGGRPRSVQAGPNFWRRRPALKRHWSITLYSHPDVMLVPNPAGKYTISFRTDLTPDADGGFTIHISPELPPDVPQLDPTSHDHSNLTGARCCLHERPALPTRPDAPRG